MNAKSRVYAQRRILRTPYADAVRDSASDG